METIKLDNKWNHIKFCDISAYLLRLKFQRYEVLEKPGPCWAFEKKEDDAFIILPHYTDAQALRPHHLIGIRKLLDERGLVDASDFDQTIDNMSKANCESAEKILIEAA